MRKKNVFFGIVIILFMILCNCKQKSDFPVLKGPYLGQKPPGDVPELFAPGIVSGVYFEHGGAIFTPDGKELFWSRVINEGLTPRIMVILHMKQKDGVWTQPELAPFNFNDETCNHLTSISPDGQRLYYDSYSQKRHTRAWVVDKIENGWGEPRLIGLNTIDNPGKHASQVKEARSGTLYFYGSLDSMPSGRGIVRSRLVDGTYQEYESLGPNVNFPHKGPYPNLFVTVDPDERFVIFVSRRPGGFSGQDLYISYHQEDDTWGPAINLGPKINTIGGHKGWPRLSPDGNYLFFVTSIPPYCRKDIKEKKYTYAELIEIQESIMNGWSNVYWVSTSFVEKLKPDHQK